MEQKTSYSPAELAEFKQIILHKLKKAYKELEAYKSFLKEEHGKMKEVSKLEEDSADMLEQEQITQLAYRQKKFIDHLETALHRIRYGTYGVCAVTGKLISKERLYVVPHTTHSIAAKLNRN